MPFSIGNHTFQFTHTLQLHIAHGTWHIAHGTLHIAHGTWHIAHGTWHIAHGTWHILRRSLTD